MSLTEGAISHITGGGATAAEFKPTLQVTELKLVQTKQPQQNDRFRLVLSDGSHMQQAMLATQINHLVKEGKLRQGSIVQLLQYTCTTVQGRMIIIILELVVVAEESPTIGHPVSAQKPVTPVPPSANPSPQSFGGNSLPGQYAATNSPSFNQRPESGAMCTGVSYNMPNSNQNSSFHNPKPEISQPTMGTYSRPPQSVYQQPPPMYNNRGPVAKNEAPPRIIPIAALNPYQGRWTIKARVTTKGELRHYNNPRGDGKVFSFDLLDSDGGEIRVTCFNAVADQFYPQIEPGRVYLISKGSLKPAQKNFNHLHHDLEIFLESTSTIQPCYEDDSSIPRQQFHFHPIIDVEGMDNNSVVDVIGVVASISPAMSIMRKNGTETQKRSLQLKDTSGRSVELTLWGNFCNAEGQTLQTMCDSGACPVLAVKAGRVGDFNGKTLGTISTSQLFIEPDFPESHKLKEWFEKEGRNTPSISLSREMSSVSRTDILKTISQIKDEKLGTSEKPDWITVYATITFVKSDNFCYTACPLMSGERQCNKKVTNNGDGKWRCDKCDKEVDECDYRYILQLQIQDHTGVSWVTAFQECGEEIMGISAKDLHILKYEKQDDDEVAKVIRQMLFSRFVFKLKVKEETFSDEQRVKSTVVKVDKVNYSSHSRLLLDLMEKHKYGNSTVGGNADSSYAFNGANNVAIGNVENRQFGVPGSKYSGNNNYGIREPVVPANQATQYGNQYNPGYTTTGSFANQLSCNSCGASGHSSANCPSIMSGPGNFPGGSYPNRASSGSGTTECFKCRQTGHWARDCPNASTVNSSYNNSGYSAGRFRAY